ncbi:MAG: rhodanese-like domain-containing protein [Actinobacteria bacterium]|nr:rhodanese-like domain-containing protein [Actinomycetota bacterium]
MDEISARDAYAQWTAGALTILDVRELPEHERSRVVGVALIPMSEVVQRVDEIPVGLPVAVMCRSGARSAQVAQFLNERGRPGPALNLEGGIIAWAAEGLPYEGEVPQ